jgi:hypothetical protein
MLRTSGGKVPCTSQTAGLPSAGASARHTGMSGPGRLGGGGGRRVTASTRCTYGWLTSLVATISS